MSWERAASIVGVLVVGWAVATFAVRAADSFAQTKINAEGVEQLRKIHETQATADQVVATLCAQGKLAGPDCPVTLPAVSAPPPAVAPTRPHARPAPAVTTDPNP